jgi:hypothetical protein
VSPRRPSALLAATLLACAHPTAVTAEPLRLDSGLLTLEATDPADQPELPELARDIEGALPRLQQWGGLRTATRVIVLPSHQALEARVHRQGYAWLRAWARYDVVYLQSPRTFTPSDDPQWSLQELLLHELSHCVMYQAAAEGSDWSEREIPLWFREGFASWTAGQVAQRWPLAQLRAYLRANAASDPLGQADRLYRDHEALVYSAAHWGFASLVQKFGQERVRALLAAMKEGRNFPSAFEVTFEVGLAQFEQELESAWRKPSEGRRPAARACQQRRPFRAGSVVRPAPCAPPEPSSRR